MIVPVPWYNSPESVYGSVSQIRYMTLSLGPLMSPWEQAIKQ